MKTLNTVVGTLLVAASTGVFAQANNCETPEFPQGNGPCPTTPAQPTNVTNNNSATGGTATAATGPITVTGAPNTATTGPITVTGAPNTATTGPVTATGGSTGPVTATGGSTGPVTVTPTQTTVVRPSQTTTLTPTQTTTLTPTQTTTLTPTQTTTLTPTQTMTDKSKTITTTNVVDKSVHKTAPNRAAPEAPIVIANDCWDSVSVSAGVAVNGGGLTDADINIGAAYGTKMWNDNSKACDAAREQSAHKARDYNTAIELMNDKDDPMKAGTGAVMLTKISPAFDATIKQVRTNVAGKEVKNWWDVAGIDANVVKEPETNLSINMPAQPAQAPIVLTAPSQVAPAPDCSKVISDFLKAWNEQRPNQRNYSRGNPPPPPPPTVPAAGSCDKAVYDALQKRGLKP